MKYKAAFKNVDGGSLEFLSDDLMKLMSDIEQSIITCGLEGSVPVDLQVTFQVITARALAIYINRVDSTDRIHTGRIYAN